MAVDHVVQRDDRGTSSPYAQSALAVKSHAVLSPGRHRSLAGVCATFNPRPSSSARRVSLPALAVVAVLRDSPHSVWASWNRLLPTIRRAAASGGERLRQRAGVETGRVPVRLVHEHAGERCGHEQMPCAAIAAQHAPGQIDLPPPFGSGSHAYETSSFTAATRRLLERQMHASTVRERMPSASSEYAGPRRAPRNLTRGLSGEGHAATVQRQSDAVRGRAVRRALRCCSLPAASRSIAMRSRFLTSHALADTNVSCPPPHARGRDDRDHPNCRSLPGPGVRRSP